MFERYEYSGSQILNMDESAIYLDTPPNYTYASKGLKRVKAVTTGAERVRISTAWTASASGNKLPIYALIPRTKPINELDQIENLLVRYKSSSTFDWNIIIEWLNVIVLPYKQARGFERITVRYDYLPYLI